MNCVKYSPDGSLFASGGADGKVICTKVTWGLDNWVNVPFTVSQGKVVVVMSAVINTTTIVISNELSMLLLLLYKQ